MTGSATATNIRIHPDALRSINSATFTGSYQAVGTPLANSSRIIKFTNFSSVDVLISWDGSTDHEIIPAAGFVLLDVSANSESSTRYEIPALTQFYAKASASTGLLYISVYYAN